MSTYDSATDVLIVGAGPSGLVAANVLARLGVDTLVVETRSGPVQQSRATIVHARTLEYLDRLGVGDRAVGEGSRVDRAVIRVRGEPIADFDLFPGASEITTYPFALGLPQGRTEALLAAELAGSTATVAWDCTVERLETHADHVVAHIRQPSGLVEKCSAQWVVGADGARSAVREALGIRMRGGTYEQVGFLADVTLDRPYGDRKITLNLARPGFVGILGLGKDQYRLFGALVHEYAGHFDVSPDEPVPRIELQRWFDEFFQVDRTIRECVWSSVFRIHSRLADQFRVGRVFVVGDAAHTHSPAGGQGMNLGIGDAYNLAWKLGLVCRGDARPALLDSYERERRPVAKKVRKGADRGFELEAASSWALERFRIHVLPHLVRFGIRRRIVRRSISQLFSQLWIEYSASDVVEALGNRRERGWAGRRAPVGPWLYHGEECNGVPDGVGHQILVFDATRPNVDAIRRVADSYRIKPVITPIPSDNAELRAHFEVSEPTVFVIRPDGHVGYRGPVDPGPLLTWLDRWYVASEPLPADETRVHSGAG